jgi:hypothetical protein
MPASLDIQAALNTLIQGLIQEVIRLNSLRLRNLKNAATISLYVALGKLIRKHMTRQLVQLSACEQEAYNNAMNSMFTMSSAYWKTAAEAREKEVQAVIDQVQQLKIVFFLKKEVHSLLKPDSNFPALFEEFKISTSVSPGLRILSDQSLEIENDKQVEERCADHSDFLSY